MEYPSKDSLLGSEVVCEVELNWVFVGVARPVPCFKLQSQLIHRRIDILTTQIKVESSLDIRFGVPCGSRVQETKGCADAQG